MDVRRRENESLVERIQKARSQRSMGTLTRCPRPYRDQLAIERNAWCMGQDLSAMNSGRLVRDSRNRFDRVNVARTRQVYPVRESPRQFAAMVFPVAFRGFVLNDEQTRFGIDFDVFPVGYRGNQGIELSRSLPDVRRDAMELAEDSAVLAIGVLEELGDRANVLLVGPDLLDDLRD